ncbi:MAG: tRNA dimethylallyltransferase [Clostridia bacterium]|nr:tRNA dimethylallyltransferase [Clostridia bacterium]
MQKLLIIGGSTAVGKSDFAINLSKFLNMEIISADSIQVYKGIEVATSKPSKEEQSQCKHHLVDFVSPFETFNAYDFVQNATKALEEIVNSGKLPVIVGGTGLYIDSFVYGFDFEGSKTAPKFDYKYVFLNDDREVIYSKINHRVDKMIENGLVDEVKVLRKIGLTKDCQCMQAIGYKEIWDYLDGESTLDEAIELMKKNTRNYAKRQLTWFRNNNSEEWHRKDVEKLTNLLVEYFIEYKK